MDAKPAHIRVIAICVFRHGDSILVTDGFDTVENAPFHRPLGGVVEPRELSSEAVSREVREELGFEVTNLRLLGTIENIFEHEGEPGHEVVFVYDGRFVDPSAYDHPRFGLTGVEENGRPISAVWRRIDSFDDRDRLVPEGLMRLLTR